MRISLDVPRKLRPVLNTDKRYIGLYGGRGGAKSHFIAGLLVIMAATRQTRIVCLREVQNSIKDSVKQLLQDKISQLGLNSLFNVLDQEIRCVNGSIIIFKGLQSYNAANIKSLEGFDVAWVEEAQTLTQHSFDMLRPTLRKPGSKLYFSWNPRYKTDAVDQFFRKNPPDNSLSIMINWVDNPWFKETELYQDMLNDYANDLDKAEHIWGGAYGSSQGAILARWVNEADREGRINDGVVYDPDGAPVIVTGDLGYRDTCSWWYWQPLYKGYNLLKYDFDHGLDVDDWMPRIMGNVRALGAKDVGKIWLPHDAKVKTFQSKHSSQEKFYKLFGFDKVGIVPMTKKADQIEAARDVVKMCSFNRKECESGIDGLLAWEFEYNEEHGIFSREPKHDWASHPSDAFSYGAQVMRLLDPPKPKIQKAKAWEQKTVDELWAETNRMKERRI